MCAKGRGPGWGRGEAGGGKPSEAAGGAGERGGGGAAGGAAGEERGHEPAGGRGQALRYAPPESSALCSTHCTQAKPPPAHAAHGVSVAQVPRATRHRDVVGEAPPSVAERHRPNRVCRTPHRDGGGRPLGRSPHATLGHARSLPQGQGLPHVMACGLSRVGAVVKLTAACPVPPRGGGELLRSRSRLGPVGVGEALSQQAWPRADTAGAAVGRAGPGRGWAELYGPVEAALPTYTTFAEFSAARRKVPPSSTLPRVRVRSGCGCGMAMAMGLCGGGGAGGGWWG